MGLADKLRAQKARVLQAAEQIGERVAFVAAEVYAPKGPNFPSTQSLAKGIVALKPRESGGKIAITIASSARSRNGYDYAERQHNDERLHHVTNPPKGNSFTDYGGSAGSREKRYAKGHKEAGASSPRFASKFLTRAIDATAADRAKILKAALS